MRMSRQAVGQMNPGKTIFRPGVIAWQDGFRVIETANGDINFFGVNTGFECQRCPAGGAKGAQPPGERELSRLAMGEAKLVPAKRRPGDERRAGAPAAVGAVAMGNIGWRPRCFVTHRPAHTPTADHAHDYFAVRLRFVLPPCWEFVDSDSVASRTRATVFQFRVVTLRPSSFSS